MQSMADACKSHLRLCGLKLHFRSLTPPERVRVLLGAPVEPVLLALAVLRRGLLLHARQRGRAPPGGERPRGRRGPRRPRWVLSHMPAPQAL